ncbi:hypothetical protein WG66_016547 [Moniliophthora roreri]|nr:hypothetical protein WG66_016547 [Moniliophthora roreri]
MFMGGGFYQVCQGSTYGPWTSKVPLVIVMRVPGVDTEAKCNAGSLRYTNLGHATPTSGSSSTDALENVVHRFKLDA